MKKHICFIVLIIALPYMLCLFFDLFSDEIRMGQGGNDIESHLLGKQVLIEVKGLYKHMDVEEYILGVLPGTISCDYDMEALKVQAILIRTNVLKEMNEKGTSDAADLSYDYLTVDERIELFGERDYERCEALFEKAVVDTAGKVLKQEGQLIMALYHEVSIGTTASAKEVMGEEIAYLQSVDSSQDVEAKHYMNVVTYTWDELQEIEQGTTVQESKSEEVEESEQSKSVQTEAGKQSETGQNEASKQAETGQMEERKENKAEKLELQVTESTENGYVKQLSVNGTIYTGEEAMEKYGLSSCNFYIEEVKEGLRFVCLGKGSCLGLSQYGANYMALNGSKMEEIIKHYYTNVTIEKYR